MSGYVEIIDCFRITKNELIDNVDKHGITDINNIQYKHIYAWVFRNPIIYDKPIQIYPKKGSVIWVKIRSF